MALRKTFAEVIEAVRNEAGLSTNSSRGIDHLDHIKQVIKRHYATLAEQYDWQHLQINRESAESRKVLQAGQRYYDFPARLNALTIQKAWVRWGAAWLPVDFGINYPNYTAFNPEADQRTDPIICWDFYGGEQFEVWPIPASNGSAGGSNEIAFQGQKIIEQLTGDGSRLDMDDLLVTLMAAAEILGENGRKDAATVKSGLAAQRLLTVRGGLGSKRAVRMGLGPVGERTMQWPRHPRFIRA